MELKPVLIISSKNKSRQYWRDLWTYKDLFLFLSLRDFQVRYKQTVVGVLWSILRPVFTMLVFTFVFHKIGKFESTHMSYPLLVLSGLLIWQLFSSIVSDSSNSLISNAGIITKIYFPRMIIPMSSTIVSLMDFCIGLILFLVISFFSGQRFSYHLFFVPVPIILLLVLSLGMGFFLSAVNVMFRDVKYIVGFMLQIGIYISPVAFQSASIPEGWRTLYALNPLVGIIGLFRWSLSSGSYSLTSLEVASSILIPPLILLIGVGYFRVFESKFADVI